MTNQYKIFLGAVILLFFCAVFNDFLALPSMTEQGLLLFDTEALLAGKKLYRDIFTVQPPLIFYLYALPVYLSHLIGLSSARVLVALGLTLIGYIIYLTLALARFHPEFTDNNKKRVEFCLLLATACVMFQTPVYFLDRDHLFFVLTLPYIFRFMPSVAKAPVPKHMQYAIGFLAAIGFCIKPQCFIVFAGINLIRLWRERSFALLKSPETIIICVIAGLYIASIWLFTPDYISIVLPMALATYSASSEKQGGLIFFSLILLAFGVTFADFRLRYTSPYRRDIFYLLMVSLFFLLYALANNGWGYTWNPLATLGLLITGFVLWEHQYLKKQQSEKALPVQPFVMGIRACMIVFLCNAAIVIADVFWLMPIACGVFECKNDQQFLTSINIANDSQPVKSFGTISIDLMTWPFYSRHTGAQWETRFNQLWMLPKFFISDEAFTAKNEWMLDYVGNAYAQDLGTRKPQLIFVDDASRFYGIFKHVDLIAFLESHSPTFTEAWKQYRFVGKIEGSHDEKLKTRHHGYYIYTRLP